MLIGLSVRGASELEKSGHIQRLKTKVSVLSEWENFSHLRIYKCLSKYHLLYMFGVKPNLLESLTIPLIIYPLENPLKIFDMNKIKNVAIKKEDITSVDVEFLSEEIGFRERTVTDDYRERSVTDDYRERSVTDDYRERTVTDDFQEGTTTISNGQYCCGHRGMSKYIVYADFRMTWSAGQNSKCPPADTLKV
uniref:Uncharacterized protein n=1 Tax=Rhodnius prolixus TaxID=13249 RepID=T1HMU6_RHOPR